MGMNGDRPERGRLAPVPIASSGRVSEGEKAGRSADVCGTKKARPVVRSADKPCRGESVLRVMGRDYLTRIT